MAAPASTGMEKADMRKILMQTKDKPVHCAIGVGKDPSVGLMVLDKLKAPKMLEKQLIDSLPDAKNTRFGTAAVDWDNDPKLVRLYLNKPIFGMARRLVKTIKGTGFSKVQIMMDDGTLVEGAADEEDEAAAAAGAEAAATPAAPAAPPPPPAAQAPALDAAELTRRLAALAPRIPAAAGDNVERRAELLKLASQGNVNIKTNNLTYAATFIAQLEAALAVPPPPPPPPAAAAPAQDGAALARELAALIPRVAQISDPARKATLAKLATDANVNIKTNNLTYAATYVAQLRAGLEGGAAAHPAAAAGGAFATQAKAWMETCRAVEADLGRLRGSILGAYRGQPIVTEIGSKFDERTSVMLEAMADTRLADALGSAATAPDAAARSDLLKDATELLGLMRQRADDPLVADLDANPFLPLSLQGKLSATLDGVAAALR